MVQAKIIGVDKDEQGNIRVKTQYKIDGVEVVSPYPQLNGMYYFVTRYTVQNFAGMTKLQILGRIKKDIQSHEKSLITKKFLQITNDAFVNAGQDLINASDSIDTASIYVDANGDGTLDTEWVISTDGTKQDKPYTPPISTGI